MTSLWSSLSKTSLGSPSPGPGLSPSDSLKSLKTSLNEGEVTTGYSFTSATLPSTGKLSARFGGTDSPTGVLDVGSDVREVEQRTLAWDAAAETVDKQQTELMLTQWRLFREQVKSLSNDSIEMRNHLSVTDRSVALEISERQSAVEDLMVVLRNSEERMFNEMDEIRRQQEATAQALDLERAERIAGDDKLSMAWEAEKMARTEACMGLEQGLVQLGNKLDSDILRTTSLIDEFRVQVTIETAKISVFEEQFPILERRVRELEVALEDKFIQLRGILAECASKNELESEVAARTSGDERLEDALNQLRLLLADAATKAELLAIQKALEEEAALRTKGDSALEELLTQLRLILSDVASQDDMRALKSLLENEAMERVKGDENTLAFVKEALEKGARDMENRVVQVEGQLEQEAKARAAGDLELDGKLRQLGDLLEKEVKDRAAADLELEEQFRQLGPVLAEAASKSDFFALRTELEREAASREQADEVNRNGWEAASRELSRELQSLLEQEAQSRSAGDEKLEAILAKFQTLLAESASKADLQTLKSWLENEAGDRVKGDEKLEGLLMELRALCGENATQAQVQTLKLLIESETADRVKGDEKLQELLAQLRPLLGEAATKDELMALKRLLESESMERVKCDEKMEGQLMQIQPLLREVATKAELQALNIEVAGCKQLLDTESNERMKGDKSLEELLSQLRPILTETKADLQSLQALLDREVSERVRGDEKLEELLAQLRSLLSEAATKAELQRLEELLAQFRLLLSEAATKAELQSWLEKEARERVNGDEESVRFLKDSLEKANRETADILRTVEASEAKVQQLLRSLIDEEKQARAAGDQSLAKELEEKFAQLRPILSDTASRNELKDTLATLRAELEKEAKERDAGDSMMLKMIQQENCEREKHHAHISRSLESHVDLYSTAGDKNDARFGDLERLVEGLANKVHEHIETLRTGLENEQQARLQGDESEQRARIEGDEQISRLHSSSLSPVVDVRISEIESQFGDRLAALHSFREIAEKEARERRLFEEEMVKKFVEKDRESVILAELRGEVDRNKQERQKEDAMLRAILQDMEREGGQRIKDILERLEQEAGFRSKDREAILKEIEVAQNEKERAQVQFQEGLGDRIKMIVEAVEFEKQERRAQMEKFQAGLQDLPIEAMNRQMKDIWANLESEAQQRKEGDDKFSLLLRNELEALGKRQSEQDADWQRAHAVTERALEDGLRSHAEETARLLSVVHGKLDDDRANVMRGLTDITDQVNKQHAANSEDVARNLKDLNMALDQEKRERMEAQSNTVAQMDEKLGNHLAKQDKTNIEMKDIMLRMNEEHNQRHIQGAEATERSIKDAVSNTHMKLMEEFALLKSGVDNKHGSMQEVFVEVGKQVDALEAALQQEQRARFAVEERIDVVCRESRREIMVLMDEAHAALRADQALVAKNIEAVQAAMNDANRALKVELDDHRANSERVARELIAKETQARDEAQDLHQRRVSEMEDRLRTNLEKLAEESQAQQVAQQKAVELLAENARGLEERFRVNLEKIAGESQAQQVAQQKAVELLAENARGLEERFRINLEKIAGESQAEQLATRGLLDTAQQKHGDMIAESVRDLEERLRANSERMAGEYQTQLAATRGLLDTVQQKHGNMVAEIARDFDEKLRVNLEKIAGENQAQHVATRGLLDAAHQKQTDIIGQYARDLERLDTTTMGFIDSARDSNQKQMEMHAQHSRAIEEGIAAARADHHQTLQEELVALKGDFSGNHGNLKEFMTEVAKQVDGLVLEVEKEQKARLAVEERLEAGLAETYTALRKETMGLAEGITGGHKIIETQIQNLFSQVENLESTSLSEHSQRAKAEENVQQILTKLNNVENRLLDEHSQRIKSEENVQQVVTKLNQDLQEAMRELMGTAAQELSTRALADSEAHVEAFGGKIGAMEQRLASKLAKVTAQVKELHEALRADLAMQVETSGKERAANRELIRNVDQKLNDELNKVNREVKQLHQELKTDMSAHIEKSDRVGVTQQDLVVRVEREMAAQLQTIQMNINQLNTELRAELSLQVDISNKDRNSGTENIKAVEEAQKRFEMEVNEFKINSQKEIAAHAQTEATRVAELERVLRQELDNYEQRVRIDLQREMEVIAKKGLTDHKTVQEKLKVDLSDLSGNHGNLSKAIADVTKKLEKLTSSLEAESGSRAALGEKLERQNKAIQAELGVSIKESEAALRLEVAQQGNKKDEIAVEIKEAHKALQNEFKDHKSRADQERISLQTSLQDHKTLSQQERLALKNELKDHKASLEEERRARDVALSGLQTDLKNREKAQKDLDGKVDQVEQRLKTEINALIEKYKASEEESAIKDELEKISQEHHKEHALTRTMVEEHLRSSLADADGQLRRALLALQQEISDHRENLATHLISQRGMLDSDSVLTSAVRRLEDDMATVHTLSSTVTQLQFDNDLSQSNIDRKLKELDTLAERVSQLQADQERLGSGVGWEEEVRRIWEAIDEQAKLKGVPSLAGNLSPASPLTRDRSQRRVSAAPEVKIWNQSSPRTTSTTTATVVSPSASIGSGLLSARSTQPLTARNLETLTTEVVSPGSNLSGGFARGSNDGGSAFAGQSQSGTEKIVTSVEAKVGKAVFPSDGRRSSSSLLSELRSSPRS